MLDWLREWWAARAAWHEYECACWSAYPWTDTRRGTPIRGFSPAALDDIIERRTGQPNRAPRFYIEKDIEENKES